MGQDSREVVGNKLNPRTITFKLQEGDQEREEKGGKVPDTNYLFWNSI